MLSDHADAVMARVEPPDPAVEGGSRVTEDLFRALTEINADGQATRNPRKLKDLIAIAGAGEAVRTIVDAFRADGVSFLRPYGDEPIASGRLCGHQPRGADSMLAPHCRSSNGWLIREFKNGLVWRSLLVQADSFELDPSNVLSPATTEERQVFFKRRNAAWSARYGGGMGPGEADRRQRARARPADPAGHRGALARAADEDTGRAGEAPGTEAEVEPRTAVEKGRREKLFRWGMAVSLLLFALAAVAAWTARQESTRANKASRRGLFRPGASRGSGDRGPRPTRGGRATGGAGRGHDQGHRAGARQAPAGRLRRRRSTAPSGKASRRPAIRSPRVSTRWISPRVYIHIADEAQRAGGPDSWRDGWRVRAWAITPSSCPASSVSTAHRPGRCCDASSPRSARRTEAQLVDMLNRQLVEPKLRLQDFSRTYTPDGSIRALHFEIYFAAGAITLTQQDAKSAY